MLRILCATASVIYGSGFKLPADYFYGRSGDLLVRSTQKSDSSIVYVSEFDMVRPSDDLSLEAEDVASTIAQALGVAPPSQTAAPPFLKTTFFHRAQANLLITLDGVGSLGLEDMPNLKALNKGIFSKGQVQPLLLEKDECSSDSVALLSCLSSGYPASKTGIVRSTWKSANGNQEAFSTPELWSAKANLADRVVQSFDGQSLALSFSGNSQEAAAFCVNPQLVKAAPNSFCLHPLVSSETIVLPRSKADLSEIFTQGAPDSILSALSENGLEVHFVSGTVSVPDEHVSLDLSVAEDLNALLEVQSFYSVSRALASNPRLSGLVKDDAPDVYFVTFSTLQPMIAKYGAESAKVKATRRVLDASVAVFLRSWAQLYEGKVLAEVLALGSAVSMEPALRKVRELAPELTGVADYFPAVYIPQSDARLCEVIQEGLKGTTFEAVCYVPNPTLGRSRSLLQEEGETLSPTSSPTSAPTTTPIPGISDSERDAYQIMVWVSVAGAFVVFFAFYSTAFMSFKKDTLLYSSFNPKWDDRKTK
jgi:hypothetical protein